MAARWRPVGGAVLTALLVVACVATFVTALLNEAPARELELPAGAGPNRLIIRAEVLGVDVNRSEMTVRLSFEPHGDLVAADGRSLTRTLFLVVNAASGPTERPLVAGRAPNPTELVISLFGGDVADFPFDRHQAQLVFDLADGLGENAQAVPFVVELRAAISGLTLLPSASLTDTGYLDLDIAIWRSNATIGFALLVMVIMWCLALAMFCVMLSIVFFDKRIEAAILSSLGAMLFAFPALRSAVPGAPPIGAAIDYFAFFWAEMIVAVSLITLLVVYIRRPLPR